jgi:glycosyltransferase involved in cell wall biosynthesis
MTVIAVDGVKLANKPCGLGNIAMSIIISLAYIDGNQVYVLMKSPAYPEYEKQLKQHENIYLVVAPPLILKKISIFWSLFKINSLVKKVSPDLFIAPNFLISPFGYNCNIKTVLYVHDLVIKEFPETMHWFNRWHMLFLFKYSLRKSDMLWCNSNYTYHQLKKYYYNVTSAKPHFIGSGISQEFHENARSDNKLNLHSVDANLIPGKPYMLYVGTAEPRKNIEFLLALYKRLSNRFDLIWIGGNGWGSTAERIDSILNAPDYPLNQVKRISGITTLQLISYYENAEFLISTSINEGLGLPFLEAMACKCPVIAPHNSACIEIVCGSGVTVEGWEIESWVKGINRLLADKEIFVKKGLAKIKEYDWYKISNKFLKIAALKSS